MSLILFSICCAIGFNLSVDALTLSKDTPASEITLENNMVIDGQDSYKITGGLNIKNAENITFKNVTFDGEGTKDILLYLTNAGNVTLENVTFTNYTKAGIYGEALASLTVNNSSFDASDTKNIGDYEGPEAELIKRSAAGIDLNLGNGAKYDVNVNYIKITNTEFKNVTDAAGVSNSTAGAIKIKIKDASRVKNVGQITIENNTFTDNVRDIVIGTQDPTSGTSTSKTGEFNILLKDNKTPVKVVNNSKDGSSETLEGTFTLNYGADEKYELDANSYYTIDKNTLSSISSENFYNLIKSIKDNSNILGVIMQYDNYTISFKSSDINLDNISKVDPLKFNFSDTTNIDELKKYEKTGVNFITTTNNNFIANNITLTTTLDSLFNGKLYLYSYDNDLTLVSNVNATNGKITLNLNDIKENYVISTTDLKQSSSVTPGEDDNNKPSTGNNNTSNNKDTNTTTEIENPQTYDPYNSYIALCIVSFVTVVGSFIYIKKKVLN